MVKLKNKKEMSEEFEDITDSSNDLIYESGSTVLVQEKPKKPEYIKGESKYSVNIIENVDFNLKHDGEIINSAVRGQISVKNESEKDCIWDIDIELSGEENTDLENNKFHIHELESQEEWTKDYNIKVSIDEGPPIKIMEKVDTIPTSKEESHTFILNENNPEQLTNFNIIIENTCGNPISNIVLSKKFSNDFQNVQIKSKGKNDTSYEDNTLKWKIDRLNPNQTKELKFEAIAIPTEIKLINSGEIYINYFMESKTYSGLKMEFIDGLSEEIHFVDRDERDEEPDIWDCQLSFENRSEFPMRLQQYEFVFGDENTEYETITKEPNIIVKPGVEWTSDPWELKSEDEPTFSETLLYTVEPSMVSQLSISSNIQPIDLYVLTFEGIKVFNEYVLKSYRKKTLDVSIEIITKGKAPIDVIHIEDTVPVDFKNPEKDEVQILVGSNTVPIEDFSFTFEPSSTTIDKERKLVIEIKDFLNKMGVLENNTHLIIKYPLTAVKPAKDTEYHTPVLFKAYTQQGGTPIETYIEPKPLTVVHVRRRTRIGKSIKPGHEKGIYNILLIYKNRGDSPKNNVIIGDFVPSSYVILESNTEFEQESKPEGNLLKWTIESIDAQEEIEIKYSIQGEGKDYSLKNIEARVFK